MKIKKNPFSLFILFISITSLCVLILGFVWAVRDTVYPTATPPKTATKPTPSQTNSSKQLLLGLGDSLTRGLGDEKGLGYFGMVRDELKQKHPSLQASNLAVSGQNSTQLREQFAKPQVQKLIQEAKWITITIGGNDLNRSSGGLETMNISKANESKKTYLANLQAIFQGIKSLNPQANLFIFGLYNPYGDLGQNEVTNQLVKEWNESLLQLVAKYPFIVVVPTFDLFQLDPNRYLYTDHFHPNNAGYTRMTTRLLQVMQDIK